MCQKEQGTEDPKSWILVLIYAIFSLCGLARPQFPKKGPPGAQ